MNSIDEFMRGFLLEERELHNRYAEAERMLWAKFAVPELFREDFVAMQGEWNNHTMLESCKVKDHRATVIARHRHHSHSLARGRYNLCHVNEEWRIGGIGYFCLVCKGSGMSSQAQVCSICHGEGYFVSHDVNRLKTPFESQSMCPEGKSPSPDDLDKFMHEFIQAERALYGHFAELEKNFWWRFALSGAAHLPQERIHAEWQNSAQIESFKLVGAQATVFATVVRAYQNLVYYRYSLIEADSNWRINDVELECHLCCRKGKLVPQGEDQKEWTCPLCGGVGWFRPQTKSKT